MFDDAKGFFFGAMMMKNNNDKMRFASSYFPLSSVLFFFVEHFVSSLIDEEKSEGSREEAEARSEMANKREPNRKKKHKVNRCDAREVALAIIKTLA